MNHNHKETAIDRDDDARAVRECLSGNTGSFDGLVRRYLHPLYAFAYRISGGDRMAAEDIAQETFLKAWRHLDRFDPERSFRTWLLTIARRTAIDRARRRRETPFAAFRDDSGRNVLEESVTDEEASVDRLLGRIDSEAALGPALESLSPDQQLLLDMLYREGFSLADVSEILDVPYNTLKSRHTRALRSLKEALTRRDASGSALRS